MIAILIGVVVLITIGVFVFINNLKKNKKLRKFMADNHDSLSTIIDKYVDGIYDYDIVIRISDIDNIRDEWNQLSKGEFKRMLYYKYGNNVSDGFYLVKYWIGNIKNKNVITVASK